MISETQILTFLNGATMMVCFVAALCFARFYRDTMDRFFKLFAIAFSLLGLERIALAISGGISEAFPYVYLFRLVAFMTIIFAVVDKNKR
jgi:hypothetical protein